jgi:FkbM family methyltransferase
MPAPVEIARRYGQSIAKQLEVADGVRGKLAVLEVMARARLGRRGTEPAGVSMKELGGGELFVRPGTSDLRNAADQYRLQWFAPPPGLGPDLHQICELGSNMGASLTALANRYPAARLVGVEPDPGNAAIARRNVSRFGPRCTLVEAGIWDADVDLVVDRSSEHGEHGFAVRPAGPDDPPSVPRTAAVTIDSLLATHMPTGPIDYVHMSIEGTEPRVFAAGGDWVERVGALRVEAHPNLDYPIGRCRADLERLGYRTDVDPQLPDKWVFAVRD